MFFDKPHTLDPRIPAKYEELRHKIATHVVDPDDENDFDWEERFNQRLTTPTDPPMLELLHSAYRAQCLMEIAREIVHESLSDRDAIRLFFRWLPALVNHYHESTGHDMTVYCATARTNCVDPLSHDLIDAHTGILVDNNGSVGTGASRTGGMGKATQLTDEHIQRVGPENTESRTFGVRLGLIANANQPKAEEINHHAPPLYLFALRMYYLILMGGCPDADTDCIEQCGGDPPGRAIILKIGGAGSLTEFLAALVELQTSKFAHTTCTHVLGQRYPTFLVVAPNYRAIEVYVDDGNGEKLREMAASDAAAISHWEDIRTKAIECDATDGQTMLERYKVLGPMTDRLIEMLTSSGMLYRGLMIQLADCMVNGTISGRELIPVTFLSISDPEETAKRMFEIQRSPRDTIIQLHEGHVVNYRA